MFGYAAVVGLVAVLFWLDPILRAVAPDWLPEAAPALHRTPRPAINEALLAMENEVDASLECPADAYKVHIFSKAPLVLYVEDFLSLDERRHLVEISHPIYEPSTVTHNGGGSAQRNVLVRDSDVAVVPRTATVRCIEARARRLQGWRDDLWIERLRVQRYRAPDGHYGYHYDWSRTGAATGGWGRVSSLMVFVDDGGLDPGGGGGGGGGTPDRLDGPDGPQVPLKGGGTAFPRLARRSTDDRWCRFIGCEGDNIDFGDDDNNNNNNGPRDNTTGVVFKPVPGNAVFWENFRPDGSGRAYDETWHAGLRVQEGTKVGLNIWSWGRVD